MEPQAGASFIPKKPLVAGIERNSGILTSVFLLGSILLFVGSVLLAGAVFGYQQYLKGIIQSRGDSLTKARAAYDPSVLESLIRLDGRIKQAQVVMQSHQAPSSVFSFLEHTTLSKVRFLAFDYERSGGGSATLTLRGEAPDFATVALQSDAFGGSRVLKDILFSDINVTDLGRVSFSVRAVVDSSFTLYSSYLQAISAAAASAPPPAPLPAAPAGAETSTPN